MVKSTPLPLGAMEIRLTHDQARELVGTARARRSSPLFLHLQESWISEGLLQQFESLDDFQQLDGVMSGPPILQLGDLGTHSFETTNTWRMSSDCEEAWLAAEAANRETLHHITQR